MTRTIQRPFPPHRRGRRLAWGAAACLLLATACSKDDERARSLAEAFLGVEIVHADFYERDRGAPPYLTTVDRRVHDGLADVFAECFAPRVVEPGPLAIDLAGGACGVPDVSTPEARGLLEARDTLLAFAALSGQVDVSGLSFALPDPVPAELPTRSGSETGFPWPLQNCRVDWDVHPTFESLPIVGLFGSWEGGSRPRMHLDLNFEDPWDGLSIEIAARASCPVRINERTIQGVLDNHLVGTLTPAIHHLDLDVLVEIDHTPSDIVAALGRVDVEVGSVATGIELPWWLGLDVSPIEEEVAGAIESELEGMLEPAFEELPALVEAAFFGGVVTPWPWGDEICDVYERGHALVIESEDPGPWACRRWLEKIPPWVFVPEPDEEKPLPDLDDGLPGWPPPGP